MSRIQDTIILDTPDLDGIFDLNPQLQIVLLACHYIALRTHPEDVTAVRVHAEDVARVVTEKTPTEIVHTVQALREEWGYASW